ncbi:integrase family protein [Anopheles sinensis]|uniref:Integrase family protein n=1 Tax=Anopheles sinensis TaxID=74873 RepID=A0A084VQZ8_ANOSI|nr:integrase family protein [Anopheles sinensis]
MPSCFSCHLPASQIGSDGNRFNGGAGVSIYKSDVKEVVEWLGESVVGRVGVRQSSFVEMVSCGTHPARGVVPSIGSSSERIL